MRTYKRHEGLKCKVILVDCTHLLRYHHQSDWVSNQNTVLLVCFPNCLPFDFSQILQVWQPNGVHVEIPDEILGGQVEDVCKTPDVVLPGLEGCDWWVPSMQRSLKFLRTGVIACGVVGDKSQKLECVGRLQSVLVETKS